MNVPNHIAIILDGNGRWAKAKGMPRSYGHMKGCANLETVCDYMKELGVKYVTVYAFSTENWKRSKEEVDGLMKLFRSYLKKCIKLADKNKMRVRVIGEISAFDQGILFFSVSCSSSFSFISSISLQPVILADTQVISGKSFRTEAASCVQFTFFLDIPWTISSFSRYFSISGVLFFIFPLT